MLEPLKNRGGLRLWIFLALSITGVFAFVVLADEVRESIAGDPESLHLMDLRVMEWVAQRRHPLLTQMMTDFTALGSLSVTLLISILVLIFLNRLKDFTGIFHLLVLLAGTAILPRFLKEIINRPRPGVFPQLARVTDPSFPSGHSFNAAAFYLTLAFFLSRYQPDKRDELFCVLLACLVSVLVGISRIYLGVHYPSDVFAGFFAGGAWSLVVAAFFIPRYRKPFQKKS